MSVEFELLNDNDFDLFMNKDSLSNLEQAVLNNDYDNVGKLLTEGSKNYNGEKLCNGYLNKKFPEHKKCLKNICCKTATYFALLINFGLVRTMNQLLNILNTKDNFSEKIGGKIKDVCEDFSSFDCYCKEYYDFQQIYLIDNNRLLSTSSETFTKLKEIGEYLNEFGTNTKKPDSDRSTLEEFPEIFQFDCLHTRTQCKFNDLYRSVTSLCELYEKNYAIVKVLLNEQVYEYVAHLLKKSESTNSVNLMELVEKLYHNNLIDINYTNPYEKRTTLLNILYNREDIQLITKMFKLGSKLPQNINTIIVDLLNQKSYTMVELLMRTATASELYTPNNILLKVIQDTNMTNQMKYQFLECICGKENIRFDNEVVFECLNNKNSLDLLNFFTKYDNFFSNCEFNCINTCIVHKKHQELDILLSHLQSNKQFIDGDDNFNPLFAYFENDTVDASESTKVLEVLLKYKPNINIIKNHNSALLKAVKMNRLNTIKLLLENGADAFVQDENGVNALHLAILNNNQSMIKLLINSSNNNVYLINESDRSNRTPLMLALETLEPIDVTQLLFSSEHSNHINLTQLDNNGMGILDLIVTNDDLTMDTKIKLFNIYFTKGIKLTEVNKSDFKPIVVRAVECDLFELVVMIMDKLIKDGDIEVGASDIITGIKNNTVSNIIVKDKKNPNFYSLVIMYIKQNFHKTAKVQQVTQKKPNTTEVISQKAKEVENPQVSTINTFSINDNFIKTTPAIKVEELENILDSDNSSNSEDKTVETKQQSISKISMSDKEKKTLISQLKEFMEGTKEKSVPVNPILSKYIVTTLLTTLVKYTEKHTN